MKILIVGAGQLGYHTAERLTRERHDVTVIEQDKARAAYLLEHLDIQVVTGSGSCPETLKRAGVAEADILVAVTNSDEVNLVACLIAAGQSRSPRKIARIRDPELHRHTRLFGRDFLNVDYAVNPDSEVVSQIESMVGVPGSTDLAEFFYGKRLCAES